MQNDSNRIDKNKLASIAALDDKTFAEMVYKAVLSAGGSEAQARAVTAASPIIKSKLKNASDKDIKQITDFLGEKNTQNILKTYGK